jgi:hypothetical protein
MGRADQCPQHCGLVLGIERGAGLVEPDERRSLVGFAIGGARACQAGVA